MGIFGDKKGLSVIELICITGICIILVILLLMGVNYLKKDLANGNDSMMVQTAESVARMDLSSTNCVVSACKNPKTCTHKTSDGYTVGYYDNVTHHILEYKPAGYNEHTMMLIDGHIYTGNKNTMIIRVKGKTGEKIQLTWIKGDNK